MTRRQRCTTCAHEVVWLLTAAGKRMPINAETVQTTDIMFDHTKHTSHFASCPQADQHRRVAK